MAKPSVARLLDRYYPFEDGIRLRDGTAPFYRWLLAETPATGNVLNVGAGSTPEEGRRLRGRFDRHIGVDPDPVVLANTDLDASYVNDGVILPFPSNSFDAVYSDWTVEHVGRPKQFLLEVFRILKPECSYFFRTTNKLHYMTLVSAHTPHGVHRLIANRARALSPAAHDPWPTHYRMNRPNVIRRLAHESGFGSAELRMIESHPSYLMFSALAFRFGVGYERLVNASRYLATYRLIILGRLRKERS